eukprot:NODE_982_length_2794_cov_0.358442.p2 type:complete len:204 gc:universal NODE_982_length_2794_cov_0.358442:1745-2356(+)
MAKKGLSLEEKRTKALEYFHDTKGVYLMKELEKLLPKSKGITSMTVKEVVQSLVDDNLVVMEKIGTSNYFWSFPSHAKLMRQKELANLKNEHDLILNIINAQEQDYDELMSKRQSEHRVDKIKEFDALKSKIEEMEQQIEMYMDFDPEVLKYKKNAIIVAKEAANRHTDNVFVAQRYLKNEHGIQSTDFNQMFEIDAKFDNIE